MRSVFLGIVGVVLLSIMTPIWIDAITVTICVAVVTLPHESVSVHVRVIVYEVNAQVPTAPCVDVSEYWTGVTEHCSQACVAITVGAVGTESHSTVRLWGTPCSTGYVQHSSGPRKLQLAS